jgi:hypothetical protein
MFIRLEGFSFNAQFGFAVAGTSDVDGDGFSDVLVGAPFASGSELTLENGYAALYRGSAGGLIPPAAWLKYGETGGLHTGADVGPVGDLNGDGRGDIAIATPARTSDLFPGPQQHRVDCGSLSHLGCQRHRQIEVRQHQLLHQQERFPGSRPGSRWGPARKSVGSRFLQSRPHGKTLALGTTRCLVSHHRPRQ